MPASMQVVLQAANEVIVQGMEAGMGFMGLPRLY